MKKEGDVSNNVHLSRIWTGLKNRKGNCECRGALMEKNTAIEIQELALDAVHALAKVLHICASGARTKNGANRKRCGSLRRTN